MQYLLLIYDAEKDLRALPEAERGQINTDYIAFTKEIHASGHFKGGDALQSIDTATTVRVRDGKPQITDGPFAETREQLGGFYLIEAKDLDEATAIAGRIPSARYGSIEIRPVMNFSV